MEGRWRAGEVEGRWRAGGQGEGDSWRTGCLRWAWQSLKSLPPGSAGGGQVEGRWRAGGGQGEGDSWRTGYLRWA